MRALTVALALVALACTSPTPNPLTITTPATTGQTPPVPAQEGELFILEDWDHKPIGEYIDHPVLEVAWRVTITNKTPATLHCSVAYTWLDVDGFALADAFGQGSIPANRTADIGGRWPLAMYKFEAIAGASATVSLCY
jgi:hypothetical protein